MTAAPAMTRIHDLRVRLERLVSEMSELEESALHEDLRPEHEAGARNLLHYVALRRHDIRDLQQDLAALGMSSLGRIESHVLAATRAVLHLVDRLGQAGTHEGAGYPLDLQAGRRRLEANTDALLGAPSPGRKVRIMVTMPSEAAGDYELVRRLVESGMNCMRINCAHDGPEQWAGMIANLHRAEAECGVRCRVAMDIAGPKLRTGPMQSGPAVLKCRPKRDEFGRVLEPARIELIPAGLAAESPDAAIPRVPVPGDWLDRLAPGFRVSVVDARGARRVFEVREQAGAGWIAETNRTTYLVPGLRMTIRDGERGRARHRTARVGPLAQQPRSIRLRTGDRLVLTASGEPGSPEVRGESGEVIRPARIGVTLPELFDCVHVGEPVWFDDGAIGGEIVEVRPGEAEVAIVRARAAGEKLGAEKGINVPDTDLRISPLTQDDRVALEFAVRHADLAGLSFLRSESDVRQLRRHLEDLGGRETGILLKIETRQAFESLPQMLLEAMRYGPVGVMIARGDLAVECGYQRLAEVQEEILWICEAAHVPAIWATQVLESLAKTGTPSRSEITDAAMGERAECVMLNKGPYIVETVQALDDILRRMEAHQSKKTAMLRKLHVAETFSATGVRVTALDESSAS